MLMKHIAILGGSLCALLTAGTAGADVKYYMGSICNFETSSSTAFKRTGHTFTNTSSSHQWVTCPVVRDSNNNITSAYMEIAFPTTAYRQSTNLRFEERRDMGGSVYGWDYEDTGGAGSRSNKTALIVWFASYEGNPQDDSAIAFEVRLAPNEEIRRLEVNE